MLLLGKIVAGIIGIGFALSIILLIIYAVTENDVIEDIFWYTFGITGIVTILVIIAIVFIAIGAFIVS